MTTKSKKSNNSKTRMNMLRNIAHAFGLFNPAFLWSRVVDVLKDDGSVAYQGQLITESASEINIAFDVDSGEMWLAAKPRHNVVTPSEEVDDMRLKAAQEMKKLLDENKKLAAANKPQKPIPSFNSMLDAVDGPLAEHRGEYAGWEIIRGWSATKYAEAMEESGKMVDVDDAVHIGNVNCNTALFSTYLPVYVLPIKIDEDYTGEPADDAAEIIGARGFKPKELRQLILGKGKFAKEGGMLCGLSLAALQLFTMWALDELEDEDPYNDFAANL